MSTLTKREIEIPETKEEFDRYIKTLSISEMMELGDKMMAVVKDSQKNRLYLWENEFLAHGKRKQELTLDEAQKLADRVLADAGFTDKRVKVNFIDEEGSAHYNSREHSINLGLGEGRTLHVLLHELSHCLLKLAGMNRRFASHGPEFAAVMLELNRRYAGELPELADLMRNLMGIKVAEKLPFYMPPVKEKATA